MSLKTSFEKNKMIDKEEFLKFLGDPVFLFGKSRFVKRVTLDNNMVEIDFVWTKMHITKQFIVLAKIYIDRDSILYSSIPDSKYAFKLAVELESFDKNNTKISVESEMGAGLLADLMGEKDFKEFINNLIDDAIDRYLNDRPVTTGLTAGIKNLEHNETRVELEQKTKIEKFTKFTSIIPQEIIIFLNRGNWENANSELTILLCKRNDDLNLWLLKSYLCEKLNRKDLALKYLQYVTEKNPKIIEGEFSRVLAEDSTLLKFINPMLTK